MIFENRRQQQTLCINDVLGAKQVLQNFLFSLCLHQLLVSCPFIVKR